MRGFRGGDWGSDPPGKSQSYTVPILAILYWVPWKITKLPS